MILMGQNRPDLEAVDNTVFNEIGRLFHFHSNLPQGGPRTPHYSWIQNGLGLDLTLGFSF